MAPLISTHYGQQIKYVHENVNRNPAVLFIGVTTGLTNWQAWIVSITLHRHTDWMPYFDSRNCVCVGLRKHSTLRIQSEAFPEQSAGSHSRQLGIKKKTQKLTVWVPTELRKHQQCMVGNSVNEEQRTSFFSKQYTRALSFCTNTETWKQGFMELFLHATG